MPFVKKRCAFFYKMLTSSSSSPSTQGTNAWSQTTLPSFNEDEPRIFAEALFQIWARLPEPVQNKITHLVVATCPNHIKSKLVDYTDSYTILQLICESNNNTLDKSILKQIKALVYSAQLLSITQKRQQLLKFYCMYEQRFTIEQKEMLAGIVGWMLPVKEQFLAPADRVVTAAITTGADFDTFQFFIDFLHVTLKMNAEKSSETAENVAKTFHK